MSVRMRALSYVSQMEGGSSRKLSEIDNGYEWGQNRIKELAVKNITRLLRAKMDQIHYLGLWRIGL